MIEVMTFGLRPGVASEAFLAADRELQTEFCYQQPGLMRRTVARSEGDRWLALTLWTSAEAADAASERGAADPVARRFSELVEPASRRVERYWELDA